MNEAPNITAVPARLLRPLKDRKAGLLIRSPTRAARPSPHPNTSTATPHFGTQVQDAHALANLAAVMIFVSAVEVVGVLGTYAFKRWGVFIVVGSNSIFIYVFHESCGRYLHVISKTFLQWSIDLWGPWGQFLEAWAVILFEIYLCYWLYRRKIFFKL